MPDEPVTLVNTRSHGLRWDHDGACWEQNNNGPWVRCPDRDWGTPMGDLLIDPWIQEAIKTREGEG